MISVRDLVVVDSLGRRVLDEVSVDVAPGNNVGLVGQSGSGKSTTALALLGMVRRGLRVEAGEVTVDGSDVWTMPERQRRSIRRSQFGYLGQDPSSSLTPTMRIGALLSELALERPTEDALLEQLARVGLPANREILSRYPHELSGGQRQRVALSRALTNNPKFLVLDEPTTGLDVVTQKMVLDELARLSIDHGFTTVIISHDLAVVARFADTVVVLRDGKVVDAGDAGQLLRTPTHTYTAHLVDLASRTERPQPQSAPAKGTPILEVKGVNAGYRGGSSEVVVLHDIELSVSAGEAVALVGPSGSGKSTLARCIVGLHAPDSGQIILDTETMANSSRGRSVEHRRRVQLVPQDPGGSLNPRRSVEEIIGRPLRLLYGMKSRDERRTEVAKLLSLVQLDLRVAERYPRQLSGGERQRVALARALATRPDVLVCDEITSALDLSVQHDILRLVEDLRARLSLTVLFITHDLDVVTEVAERMIVLQSGAICEEGPVSVVLGQPRESLTQSLVEASTTLETQLDARDAVRSTKQIIV